MDGQTLTSSEPISRPEPFVVVDGISKRFTGTQALDSVSFTLAKGEVHALIGENGAGKSTLIKILGGVHLPDGGSISIAGEKVSFATPRAALASGIVVIPQEMRIVPALSVAENVMMGHVPTKPRVGLVPRPSTAPRTACERTRALLAATSNSISMPTRRSAGCRSPSASSS